MPVKTARIPISGGTIPVNLGTTTDIRIPTTFIYRNLILTLSGSFTCTSGNNTAAKTKAGDVWNIIQDITLQYNGAPTARKFSGEQLWWINRLLLGAEFIPSVASAVGDGTTANPTFRVQLCIPFTLPGVWEPFQFSLPAKLLNDITMRITWGTATSINDDASALSVTARLEGDVQYDFMLDAQGNPIDYNPTLWYPISVAVPNAAAVNSARFNLPTTNAFRGLLVNVKNGSGVDSHLLTGIRVRTTGENYFERTGDSVRLETDCRWNIGNASPRSASSNKDGWYFIDFLTERRDPYVSESLPTTLKGPSGNIKLSDLWAEFDISAAAAVTIYAFQLVTKDR
jgi:hypothetical protein